jgi:hypothetical protein
MMAVAVIFDLLMWFGLNAFMSTEPVEIAEGTNRISIGGLNIENVLDSQISDTYTQVNMTPWVLKIKSKKLKKSKY